MEYRFSDYFENRDLIFQNQYGLRKHHSTEFASFHLTNLPYYLPHTCTITSLSD